MGKSHKDKMLEWIDRLGLIVVHTEIKPYGPGTRRYMVGRHIEEPVRSHQLPSGKWQSTHGKQEWLTPEPLDGIQLNEWLTNYEQTK
jgi:phosphoketolase